jgi:hypothetical protein
VTHSVSETISNVFHSLFGDNPVDHDGLIHPWTNVTVMVRKTDEILQTSREDTQSGFIAFMVIFGIILLLTSLVPSAYHIFLKVKEEKIHLNDDVPKESVL